MIKTFQDCNEANKIRQLKYIVCKTKITGVLIISIMVFTFYYITDISSFLGVCSYKTPSQLIMKEGFNKMKEVSC